VTPQESADDVIVTGVLLRPDGAPFASQNRMGQ
jgi:hypothetical protein